MKIFIKKLAWEFWPTWLMYFPMILLWPYFMLRVGKIKFWELTNPGLENGGLIGDSKNAPLSQLPEKNKPIGFVVDKNIHHSALLKKMNSAGVVFPCIAKPDSGMRGKGVRKINDKNELEDYFNRLIDQTYLGRFNKIEKYLLKFKKDSEKGKILIQNFINEEKEFGVFYIRKPNNKNGEIVSLMERKFPELTGNGKNNIKELILEDERACIYKNKYFVRYVDILNIVPKKNEIITLGSIGSHNLGTVFLNRTDLINTEMINTFDHLSKNISKFYYGRYDVKAKNLDELSKGNFKVLELNGVNAEPVHMYDSGIKPWQGWSIVVKFWLQAFYIAMQNKKNTKL